MQSSTRALGWTEIKQHYREGQEAGKSSYHPETSMDESCKIFSSAYSDYPEIRNHFEWGYKTGWKQQKVHQDYIDAKKEYKPTKYSETIGGSMWKGLFDGCGALLFILALIIFVAVVHGLLF